MQAQPATPLGRTLPEKFEEIAGRCDFAVLILSADDNLIDKDTNKIIKRARQNVILEVGYFWGALRRRGNVAFLIHPEIEIPSDLQGIGWIRITDDLGETKLQLRKELENAGLLKAIGVRGRDEQLERLLGELTGSSKAEALRIEDKIYNLVKDDVDLLLRHSEQYVSPAREAVAVVAGRILYSGVENDYLVDLLRKLRNDPDKWVRKKADDALHLLGS